MQQRLRRIISQDAGRCALIITDFSDNSTLFSHNVNAILPAASLAKLAIAVTFIQHYRSWRQANEPAVIVASEDYVPEEPFRFRRGRRYSAFDLLRAMLLHSDNTAANSLLTYFGLDSVNKAISDLGLLTTRLSGLFMKGSASRSVQTSALDILALLRYCLEVTRSSVMRHADAARLVLSLMVAQDDQSLVSSGLPRSICVAEKTGQISAVLDDCGIIDPFGARPVGYVFLQHGFGTFDEQLNAARQVGLTLTNYLLSQGFTFQRC